MIFWGIISTTAALICFALSVVCRDGSWAVASAIFWANATYSWKVETRP